MTDEIAFLLDLFGGQLSYSDIYSGIPIRMLTQMSKARVRLVEKKERIQQGMLENSRQSNRPGSPHR